ncbi:hypothetical protein [Arthrobacter psychrochitiniphilus]|uniref:hypothetical protein n=1 Tax=Arthrobacter psychrochitiniphilus TaxID=291045 RepID=UPI003F7C04DC
MTLPVNFSGIRSIANQLTALGVTPDPKILHGIELYENIATANEVPTVDLLDLTGDEAIEYVLDHARRQAGRGYNSDLQESVAIAQNQILEEIKAAYQTDMTGIIEQLRHIFDASAAVVRQALAVGIRAGMDAGTVLSLEHPDAVNVWKQLPEHLERLNDFLTLRETLGMELGLQPQPVRPLEDAIDPAVYFAHPSLTNFSVFKQGTPGGRAHVFLRFAQEIDGQLHLNTPAESLKLQNIKRNARPALV